NAPPAQTTIPAASGGWTRGAAAGVTTYSPRISAPIDAITDGTPSTPATHSRRPTAISSGVGAATRDGATRPSATAEPGQGPGPSWRISGSIGQIHIAPGAATGCGRGLPPR